MQVLDPAPFLGKVRKQEERGHLSPMSLNMSYIMDMSYVHMHMHMKVKIKCATYIHVL